jgi:hypothetical protein
MLTIKPLLVKEPLLKTPFLYLFPEYDSVDARLSEVTYAFKSIVCFLSSAMIFSPSFSVGGTSGSRGLPTLNPR